jgi:opacity protein-like surface antigen
MKKIFAAIALTAVIASPALAATAKRQPVNANAQYVPAAEANGVYDASGARIGADPDAFIRYSIRQNESAGQGGQ